MAKVVCRIAMMLVLASLVCAQANLGNGRVTSVTAQDGGCVTGPLGPAVQSWNVEQGKTYQVTLTNVTECSGSSIEVLVQSSKTGNIPATATEVGSGIYQFTVTMPGNACFTYPIRYCTTGFSPSTGVFARRSDGGSFQAHLRAATSGCSIEDTDCSNGGGGQTNYVKACKWYDANADGLITPLEPPIQGWKVALDAVEVYTGADGCYTFAPVSAGTYTVSEFFPAGLWRQTGLLVNSLSQPVTTQPTAAEVTVPPNREVDFGDVCLGTGGGLTLGFWSNKNGQALFLADDLAAMVALNLRNADGSVFDPASYAQFRPWLLSANATNMAYMLSAQLSAMKLNVLNGFVNGSGMVYAPSLLPYAPIPGLNSLGYISVNDLITAANTALSDAVCGNPCNTASPSLQRPYQEALKNVLDALNNNGSVYVQPAPCPFTTPY